MTRDQARQNTLFTELLMRFEESVLEHRQAQLASYDGPTDLKLRDKLEAASERVDRLRGSLIDAYVTELVKE